MKTPQLTLLITMDPIRDGNNWYPYAQNNPVNFRDLFGLECQTGSDKEDTENISVTPDNNSSVKVSTSSKLDMANSGTKNPYENFGVSTPLPKASTSIQPKSSNYYPQCDVYAWNAAVNNGDNPFGQNGEDWSIDLETVSDIYDKYPNLRFCAPQNNTTGFAFYFDNGENNPPTHIEYYTNLDEDTSTYNRYRTDGLEPVTIEKRKISDSKNRKWVFVPIYSK